MRKTFELLKQKFESSSGLTEQFAEFYKVFKKEFREFVKSIGGEKVVFSRGHFELSGFFIKNKQVWYFSLSDLRYFKGDFLLRTAKDYKDYTGGSNNCFNMNSDFKNTIKNLIK